jgi:hypothetical protein
VGGRASPAEWLLNITRFRWCEVVLVILVSFVFLFLTLWFCYRAVYWARLSPQSCPGAPSNGVGMLPGSRGVHLEVFL